MFVVAKHPINVQFCDILVLLNHLNNVTRQRSNFTSKAVGKIIAEAEANGTDLCICLGNSLGSLVSFN